MSTPLLSRKAAARAIQTLAIVNLAVALAIPGLILLHDCLRGRITCGAGYLTLLLPLIPAAFWLAAKGIRAGKLWGRAGGILFALLHAPLFPWGSALAAYLIACLSVGWQEGAG